MDGSRIHTLIRKYNAGQCSPEEKQYLEDWYLSFEWSRSHPDMPEEELQQLKENAWQQFMAARNSTPVKPITRRPLTRWRYAAAITVLLGCGALYFLLQNKPARQSPAVAAQPAIANETIPAGRYATLTLAGGKVLRLSDTAGEQLLKTGDAVVQRQGSSLVYSSPAAVPATHAYHELATPNGLRYSVTLSDGSRVWLNAASSIRYPATFGAQERSVQVTGEAYFEIAADAARPFYVNTPAGERIAVLGTKFNVNTYNDIPGMHTTLLEGAVSVTHGRSTAILRPGQQAVTDEQHGIRVSPADVNEVMAWRKGLFDFNNTDIRVIMRQLSRWYDVEVRYTRAMPARAFTGEIKCAIPLERVLEILEQKDLRFRLDGKVIYVIP